MICVINHQPVFSYFFSWKSWKRRWFVLSDRCLYYFQHTAENVPKGIIPLENVKVIYPVSKQKLIVRSMLEAKYCFMKLMLTELFSLSNFRFGPLKTPMGRATASSSIPSPIMLSKVVRRTPKEPSYKATTSHTGKETQTSRDDTIF